MVTLSFWDTTFSVKYIFQQYCTSKLRKTQSQSLQCARVYFIKLVLLYNFTDYILKSYIVMLNSMQIYINVWV